MKMTAELKTIRFHLAFAYPAFAHLLGPFGLALLLVGGGAFLPACADRVATETRSCPCADGNVCCASGVCAQDQASCGSATLALAMENAGTWTGYLENTTLASGSDGVRISLAVVGDAAVGEFILGTAQTPPVPTIAIYPDSLDVTARIFAPRPVEYVEGFVYHAKDLRWESRRLKFTVDLSEGWQAQCDLYQPIIPVGDEKVICPPNGFAASENKCFLGDGTTTPFDCKYLEPCLPSSHCQCTTTTCKPVAGTLSVDVALRGDLGDGSTLGLADGNSSTNIRMMRTAH